METNTVILSLSEYNTLRDFRENLEKNNTHFIAGYHDTWCGRTQTSLFISTDEAVKIIAQKNEELLKKCAELTQEIYDLRNPKPKEYTIKDVKKMSLWEFWKWKRKAW